MYLNKIGFINCSLTDDCMLILQKGLAFNKSIFELDLSGNKITSVGINHLIPSLSQITSLNLWQNQISEFLPLLSLNMQKLDISDNMLTG